jgi:hypothetical protein
MTDPFSMTAMIGGGLVICGYMIGRSAGRKRGSDEVMRELIDSKLIEPMDVLRHYANMGNERAQLALEKLNAERKAKFNARNDAED